MSNVFTIIQEGIQNKGRAVEAAVQSRLAHGSNPHVLFNQVRNNATVASSQSLPKLDTNGPKI